MKTILTTFGMLCACLTCALAGEITIKGTAAKTNGLTPKPAFVINYDKAIEPVSETAKLKDYLYDNSVFMVNETKQNFVVNVSSDTTQITFLTEDIYYAPSEATIKITIPKLKYVSDDESAQTESETFEFTIGEYTTLEPGGSMYPGEDKSLVIRSGAQYHVTNNAKWKQIVVENNAGIVIDAGKTLTATDSVYFLSKQGDVMNMAYLINNGNFDANAIFTKYIDTYQYAAISFPVQEIYNTDMTISRNISDENEEEDYSGIWTFVYYNPKGFWPSTATDSVIYEYDSEPIVAVNYYNDFTLRFKGEINDNDSYTFENKSVKEEPHEPIPFNQPTKMNNPYQAPIDWRSIYENGRTDAKMICTNTNLYLNDYYVYNTFSGITTYDGPMEYGYLQPAMSNVGLWNNATCNTTMTKEDLTPYKDVVEKYKDSQCKYPYIRFYCDDANYSKGVGQRSVAALYIIPDKIERDNYGESLADPKYDVNFTCEESKDAEYENSYPYLSIYKSYNKDLTDVLIGAFSYSDGKYNIETDTISLDVRLRINTKNKTDNIKLGILDSNFSEYGIKIKGNYINDEQNEITTTLENNSSDNMIGKDKCFRKDIYITLEIKKPKDEDPTSINTDKWNNAIKVAISGHNINVSGIEEGDICNIYSTLGSCLDSQKAKNNEINFEIGQKGIYFVEILNKGSKTTKKILVD